MQDNNKATKKLSVVLPIYNEAELLPHLYERLRRVLVQLDCICEIIFVDDGSTDQSLPFLHKLQAGDPRITVLELSRNWGQQAALSAGLAECKADAVIMMDADMQDPPEIIPEMLLAWRNGAQIVTAERRSRSEHGPRRWLTAAFYRIFNYFTGFQKPMNSGTYCLLDAAPAKELRKLSESNRYLPGLRDWIGFRTASIPYDRARREIGTSRQSWSRLWRYGFDAIFSFSYKPMRMLLTIGLSAAVIAILGAILMVIERIRGAGLFHQPVVVGYTSTICAILFLSGIQLAGLGIVCEYIGRIYDETKARPLYIVRNRFPATFETNATAKATRA